MDRRHFLRWGGFITTSTVLTACGGGGGDGGFFPILPAPPADNGNLATGTNWKFPQSVASGDPRPDSVLLWTRVVPGDAHDVNSMTGTGAADFSVRLRVTAADNAGALGSNTALGGALVLDTTVPVQTQWDHTVRHRLTGLEPGRTYYYQFVAGDVRSRVGRFRTAPAVDAAVPQLKFAFLSCQDWSIHHWGAFSDLATQELDFVVHLGDYIYETVGEAFQTGAVESRHGLLALPNGAAKGDGSNARYATTLADYRYLYKSYRSDARLQAVHERFAFVAVWDDHEFTDDAWQDAETYSNGSFSASTGGNNTRQRERRRSANQAWFEFMLADIAFDEKTTGIDSVKIYRDLRFGRLAHLVMTDERLYRSDHIVPEAMPNPATGAALGSIGARYMVPQPLISALEQQKIAATRAAQPAGDALANVSMLGSTQRAWWKSTMAASNATWKLWGNEVSLLRMGLDGTQAIGTLVALQSIATLATQIGEAAPALGGNVPAAAGLVAAVAAGAAQATAAAGAMAIASGGAAAGVAAGLTATQAGLAEQALTAARNARGQAAGSVQAQATAGAQVIAFGYVKADVIANKAASPFVVQAGLAEALGPYFTKFLINCDQWDGYGAERREMLAHLRDRKVRNVVALTGDIHAFFAGAVHDDFDAEGGGTPVMVDLVTAGVSSDSFFNYLSSAADGLAEGMSTLVYFPLTLPVPQVGNVRVNVNLLDYTLGMPAPSSDPLITQIRVPLRGALAAAGVPEAQLDATTTAVLGALQQSEAFTGQLLPVAQQLASLRSNPWLALSQTDAQGYALVTLTEEALRCEFRQVNRLVGGQAPAAPTSPLIARSLVATVRSGVPAVTMG